jgi:hypothetical protein
MDTPRSLVLTLGALAGCATAAAPAEPAPAAPGPVDPAAAVARVDANLARLRGLTVVDVGGLVVEAPAGDHACYGECPEHVGQSAAARERAAVRLERLVAAAEAAPADPSPAACEPAAIDRNLEALRALRIVEVRGLLVETAKASPNCYNQPCPHDVAAAEARTCERAGKLAGIVTAAKSL